MYNYLDDIGDFIKNIKETSNMLDDVILNLPERNYTKILNDLFRTIHSLKAKTYYFESDEIASVLEKSEDILSFLLQHDCTVGISVKFWFKILKEQLLLWCEELESVDSNTKPIDERISFYNNRLDISPNVKVSGYKMDIVDTHRLIILQNHLEMTKSLSILFNKTFKLITTTNSIKNTETILYKSKESIILISDIKFNDGTILDLVKKKLLSKTNPIILSKLSNESVQKIKDVLKIDDVYSTEYTDLADIKKVALRIVNPDIDGTMYIPFSATNINLSDLIKTIKPLPEVILQVKEACFDDETSYDTVGSIIEQDPAIVSKVIRIVNSPYFGIKHRITSVRHAALMLGKSQLYAIIVNGLSEHLVNDLDLSMYGINYNLLIGINNLRSSLLTEWLKLLNISENLIESTNTLSLLLVLGTNLSSQALNHNLQSQKFKSLIIHDEIHEVEKQLLSYNSYDISLKLFEAWNFPEPFIKISRLLPFEDVSAKSITDETHLHAFLITIVHKIFRLDGRFDLDSRISMMVEKAGLDPKILITAWENKFGSRRDGRAINLLPKKN